MVFINQSDGARKMSSLVDALTAFDRRRRRRYDLSIATCYCNPKALRAFINAVRGRLKIANIYLYLDRREAIAIGQAELKALKRAYPGLLCIYAVRAARLFHTKSYCLAAYDDDEALVEGRLAIGSANLTNPGLHTANGNIESLVTLSDIPLITEFLDFFEREDILIELNELTQFNSDDTIDFQYALLISGVFSHKWAVALSRYFSVRYELNREGKQLAQGAIEIPGFRAETATIAKSYFNFDVRRWRPTDDGLTKKYSIECFLGRWIPKAVCGKDEKRENKFEEFKRALFDNFNARVEMILVDIMKDYKRLLKQEIIDELDVEPAERFQEHVEILRNSDELLDRMWSGRQYFELPYNIDDVENITETYKSLWLTIELSRRKNRTMKAVEKADELLNLAPIMALAKS